MKEKLGAALALAVLLGAFALGGTLAPEGPGYDIPRESRLERELGR